MVPSGGMGITTEELAAVRQAEAAYESLIALAREDCALFCELVLRDEETGQPIEMTAMHLEWHHAANQGQNLIIWAFPESGKSQMMSIGRTLWLLGKNPRLRIAILAAAERQVKKLIASLRRHIESNTVLHKIFPDLKRGDLWTDNAISVQRPGIIKDPSVQAISPSGAIQGARVNVLIIDDVLVEENTRTAYQRDKIATWIRVSAFSRLSRKSQVVMLANAFHPDDFAHQLARLGWWAKKYPVLDEQGKPTYPQRWPMERIERVRSEELGPTEFARMMLCQARADEDARFQAGWIDQCKLRGRGYPMPRTLEAFVGWVGPVFWDKREIEWQFKPRIKFPPGFIALTGVDLGVSQRDAADPSVLFTILLWPDGTRQVIDVRRGKWQSPAIIKNVLEVHEAYGSVFLVENNAAQEYLVQWIVAEHPDIVIKGFRTGKNKRDLAYGVESIAGELEDQKWLIPSAKDGSVHPNVRVWEQEMLYYAPDGHTGDVLMACVVPGARVTTRRGLVPIEQVLVGDDVLTHLGNWKPVTGLTQRHVKEDVYRFHVAGAAEPFALTGNHPVWSAETYHKHADGNRLTPREFVWRPAAEVRAGRRMEGHFLEQPIAMAGSGLRVDLAQYVVDPSREWGARWYVEDEVLRWSGCRGVTVSRYLDVTGEIAFLCGLYAAEGSVAGKRKGHMVQFALNRNETYLATFVARVCRQAFGAETKVRAGSGANGMNALVYSVIAARFFKAFGRRDSKAMPWELWHEMPIEARVQFARGWFVGDGSLAQSKGGPLLGGVSISRDLLEQVQQALHGAGYPAALGRFQKCERKVVFGTAESQLRASWRLQLSAMQTARFLVESRSEELARWGQPVPTQRSFTNSRRSYQDGRLYVRPQRIDVVPYEGVVHNLHVADDESYVVEGVAVHNCWIAREGARAYGAMQRHRSASVRVLGGREEGARVDTRPTTARLSA